MNENSKAFIMYKDWEMLFEALDDTSQMGEVIMALFKYANTGEMTEFTGAKKMAFLMMTNQMKRDNDKYEERCQKSRESAAKRWAKKASKKDAAKCDGITPDANNANKKTKTKTDTKTKTETKTVTEKDTDKKTETDTDTAPAVVSVETPRGDGLSCRSVGSENTSDLVSQVGRSEGGHSADRGIFLTDAQMRELEGLSSCLSVERYIAKLYDWQKENHKRCRDPFTTIKRWIAEDNAKYRKPANTSEPSFDLDSFEKFANDLDLSKLSLGSRQERGDNS